MIYKKFVTRSFFPEALGSQIYESINWKILHGVQGIYYILSRREERLLFELAVLALATSSSKKQDKKKKSDMLTLLIHNMFKSLYFIVAKISLNPHSSGGSLSSK